jgi:hypothetical protein
MVNPSKANDPRFRKKWDRAGAISPSFRNPVPPESYSPETDKQHQEWQKWYRERLVERGNLSPTEINALMRFKTRKWPSTPQSQVRYAYLDVKATYPQVAERMKADTDPLLKRGIKSVEDVKSLCQALYRHTSNFLIRFKDQYYGMTNNQFGTSHELARSHHILPP